MIDPQLERGIQTDSYCTGPRRTDQVLVYIEQCLCTSHTTGLFGGGESCSPDLLPAKVQLCVYH